MLEVVRASFKPEFLNRLDDLVVFSALTRDGAGADRAAPDRPPRAAARRAPAHPGGHRRGAGLARRRGQRPGVRRPPAAPPGADRDRRPARQGDPGRRGHGRRHGPGGPLRRRPDRGPADGQTLWRPTAAGPRSGRPASVRGSAHGAVDARHRPGRSVAERRRRGLPVPARHGGGWRNPYEGKFTVSIDPSSIPNFGGQPEPQPAGPRGPRRPGPGPGQAAPRPDGAEVRRRRRG